MKQVTIKNEFLSLTVLDFGAIIKELKVMDNKGETVNVVAGFPDPENYRDDPYFVGACIGRYAGRISKGGFSLKGRHYHLDTNEGVHLHSGTDCFGKKSWTLEEINRGSEPLVKLSHSSPDMEGGYPGNIKASVTYRIAGKSLHMVHEATTDRPTVLNMTNHSYYRLDNSAQINDHQLLLNCSQFLETDDKLLPTGKILDVAQTEYDFRAEKPIGRIRMDTPFVRDKNAPFLAKLYSEKSGIRMTVRSNQPGVVIFTPDAFAGICFETQNFPDAPNIPSFPDSKLIPGQTYCNKAVFEFDLVI